MIAPARSLRVRTDLTRTAFVRFASFNTIRSINVSLKSAPVKLALYATAFSRYAPLNVDPLKSDSLISADVKFALLKFSLT